MSEILKHKGRLAEKELEAKKLKLRLEGLVKSLRDLLDPFESVEDLQGDIIADQGLELASYQVEYKRLLEEIKAINKVLGRP